MKYLLVSVLTLSFHITLLCQIEFQRPRHADGRLFASEKFEMMEKLWKLRNSSKEKTISNTVLKSGFEEMQVGDSGVTEAELHAVVNPTDPNNIVVGVINIDVDNPLESIKMSIYVTYDLGDSWTKSDFTGFGGGITLGGGDPMFAFDNEGELYFSWLKLDATVELDNAKVGMYVSRSSDGGMNWEELTSPISEYAFTDVLFLSDLETFVDKQWMASDLSEDSPYLGNVYVAYLNLNLANEVYDIVFKKKHMDSLEFDSLELKVSHDQKILAQFVNLEVDNKGNIHLVYLSYDDLREDRNAMYYCMSSDGGETFTEPKMITEFHFPDFGSGRLRIDGLSDARLYPCPQLGVDRSGGEYEGRLYLTFTAFGIDTIDSEGADIYLMSSDNLGEDWSSPRIVNDDLDPAKHQYYSSITVTDDGQPALAWYDRRNDLNDETITDYFLGYSDDGGETFEQFNVSQMPTYFAATLDGELNFGIGEYNEIVTSDKFIIPFWTDGRTNNNDLAVYAYFYDMDASGVVNKSVILTDKISVSSPMPNPAKEAFSFNLDVKEVGPVKVELFDVGGNSVKRIMEHSNYIGKKEFRVETTKMSAGMYLLSVTSKEGTQTRKVIIE